MNEPTQSTFDRRGFLRVGGTTVTLAAIVAACGGTNDGAGPEGVASAGTRPPLATAPSAAVTDVVLLRTATSLHYNAMDVTALVSGVDGIDPEIVDLATAYDVLLQQQADILAEATVAAGGEAYEQRNMVVNERVVGPAAELLASSETQANDAARLLHAVATLAAATHQAFVAQLTDHTLRQAAMSIGVVHGQVAAALASVISPDNIVPLSEIEAAEPTGVSASPESTVAVGLPSTSEAPAATEPEATTGVADVEVYMVPGAFGALSPAQVVLGKNGVEGALKRRQLNLDTPSLNTMVY